MEPVVAVARDCATEGEIVSTLGVCSEDTVGHLGSERVRRVVARSLLSWLLTFAPAYVPAWRYEPRVLVTAVLPIGEPTPSLAGRLRRLG
jgi:hypothetical protein